MRDKVAPRGYVVEVDGRCYHRNRNLHEPESDRFQGDTGLQTAVEVAPDQGDTTTSTPLKRAECTTAKKYSSRGREIKQPQKLKGFVTASLYIVDTVIAVHGFSLLVSDELWE